jgi:hypothetical protein
MSVKVIIIRTLPKWKTFALNAPIFYMAMQTANISLITYAV